MQLQITAANRHFWVSGKMKFFFLSHKTNEFFSFFKLENSLVLLSFVVTESTISASQQRSVSGLTLPAILRKMISKQTIIEFFEELQNDLNFDVSKPLLYGYFFTHSDPEKLKTIAQNLLQKEYSNAEIFKAEIDEKELPFFYPKVERTELHNAESQNIKNLEFYKFAEENKLDSYDGFDLGNNPIGTYTSESPNCQ